MRDNQSRNEEILRLARNGLSASEIGLEMGCSSNTVICVAYRAGVALQGGSAGKRGGKPADTARNEEIARLFKDGLSGGEIAKELGITRHAVMGTLRRAGVRRGTGRAGWAVHNERAAKRSEAAKERLARERPSAEAFEPAGDLDGLAVSNTGDLDGAGGVDAISLPADAAAEALADRAEPVAFLDLQACHCRWPLWGLDHCPGDLKTLLFCGAAVETGAVYCAHHLKRARARARRR